MPRSLAQLRSEYLTKILPLTGESLERALDVGCGTGEHLSVLGELLPNTKLFGIDISESRVRCARRALKAHRSNISILKGDGLSIPFPTSSFDLVMSHLTLPYVRNDRVFLRECIRVLRPGGVLWITTHGVGFYAYRIGVKTSIYHKSRHIVSIVSGLLNIVLGIKLYHDTPSHLCFITNTMKKLKINVIYSNNVTTWNNMSRIIEIVGIK